MNRTATRVARSVTFTFETLEDKARYQALAKRQGLSLAGLIKHLLALNERDNPA